MAGWTYKLCAVRQGEVTEVIREFYSLDRALAHLKRFNERNYLMALRFGETFIIVATRA
jgi:hypothetical protein